MDEDSRCKIVPRVCLGAEIRYNLSREVSQFHGSFISNYFLAIIKPITLTISDE